MANVASLAGAASVFGLPGASLRAAAQEASNSAMALVAHDGWILWADDLARLGRA